MFEHYRLHHVGIVFPTLAAAEMHLQQFCLQEAGRGYVEQWHSQCIFTQPAEGTALELVVPDAGPLLKFNRGIGGVHHFAYEVDDIVTATQWCLANDMTMLEPEAIQGAGNFLCNFIHPLATRGIQIELVQPL